MVKRSDAWVTARGPRPIHPGEVLKKDFLKPLGMSVNELARLMYVSADRMNDIVLQRRGIAPDTALRLAMFFGGDPQSWLNMQQAYDLKVAEERALDRIALEVTPLAILRGGFALGA